MDHSKSLGLTVIAWDWNGDGGNDKGNYMNMVDPAWYKNPFPDNFKKDKCFNIMYRKL